MECAVYGNVMSLITPEGDFNTNKTIKKPHAFYNLFSGNQIGSDWDAEAHKWIYKYAIVNHDKYKLVLPATTLSDYCYYNMFNSSGLTEAPELPATTLANYCYSNMFNYCRNLTVAPELKATTLANGCYSYLFNYCMNLTVAPKLPATKLASDCYQSMFANTAITEAPELPATTLENSCYAYMFRYCKNLTVAPKLPATKLASWCYEGMFANTGITEAPELKAKDLSNLWGCYYSMFNGCRELTKAPNLPATKLEQWCYAYMFQGCTKLEVAPVLPAAELAAQCYYQMFYNCYKLKSLTCLATSIADNSATYNWLYRAGFDVDPAVECTFTKAASATWNNMTGVSGDTNGWYITNRWTIKDAE